ncbi:MAG: metallophosphoesterase [Candidatus Aenigmarchaeota archaeon]|nr:metallophosphoesterase [Candidatus Aenigmarchaeota archaeon]
MKPKNVMFITNYPAMKIGNYLLISDLHLGITRELWLKGVSLPSQAKKFADRINKLRRMTKTRKLIILGDLKHKVPGTSLQELREIPEFLSLLRFDKIILLKGNHDDNIEILIPNKLKSKITIRKTISIGKYFLSHGHQKAALKSKKIIVIGHNQPGIKFQDAAKAIYTEPAWIRGYLKNHQRIIIMPAFNELSGFTTVNKDALLGPVAKQLDFKRSHAYLMDGTDLGVLSSLKMKR